MMNVLRAILKVWSALPPALQFLVVLAVLGLAIYLISNRGFMDNLTHLLQAFPPIVYFPIAIRSNPQVQKADKSKHSVPPPTPTP